MSTGNECFDADACIANELYGRIRELEAEVKALGEQVSLVLCAAHVERTEHEKECLYCRAEAAEAKLAAIEGLERLPLNRVNPDLHVIIAAEVRAILRGEDT